MTESTMTCQEAFEALIEAEPRELVAGEPTPLGRHLDACARCRHGAELVLRGTAALDAWLDRPRIDPSAVDRALAGGVRGPSRARRLRWALPLAAAAALATLLLVELPDRPLPGQPYDPREPAPGLALDVPADRSAAVLETTDPDITVVWFYEGD